MRRAVLACLALTAALAPAPARAQPRVNLVISDVRVGFPGGDVAGDPAPLFKAGAWAPVYVEVKAEEPGLKGTEGRIDVVVSTPDPDDVTTSYTVNTTLGELPAGAKTWVKEPAYIKLAGGTPEVTVTLRAGDQALGPPFRKAFNGIDPGQALYLTLGGRLTGLREGVRANEERGPLIAETVAYLDDVRQLPTQWFGYQGVDAVFLCTSNDRNFLLPLTTEPRYRPALQALREWVRRGGLVVVCVGRNRGRLGELQELLPVAVSDEGKDGFPQLSLIWPDGEGGDVEPVTGQPAVEVTRFKKKDGRTYHTLLSVPEPRGQGEQPAVVQAPYGLGRVVVLAFDPDQGPFVTWKGQPKFWRSLLRRLNPAPVAGPEDGIPRMVGPGGYNQGQELLNDLHAYLEDFDDVPVIPFTWVALFIFAYIIVVGPLEYYVLKYVVKRPELTWVTFPTVVLSLSALAYFAAYQLKGKDLRVRKVDVVDVDLGGGETVGHSWFTLFSPRIQHYTLGVEPAAPDWAAEPAEKDARPPVLVSWMNRPEYGDGRTRARRQSFFRRSYEYAEDATGLKGVPLQVWSTKSFTATWQGPLPKQPLVAASLKKGDPNDDFGIRGTITWYPGKDAPKIEAADAHLIYRGRVYPFAVEPGKPADVRALARVVHEGNELSHWIRSPQQVEPPYYSRRRGWMAEQPPPNLDDTVRGALFTQAQERGLRNTSLRSLDQTWRVRQEQQGEVVLVVRLKSRVGAAEEVSRDAASPSRLWLGSLPGSDKPYEKLDGVLRQETYVRVFIPVQP